MYVGVPLFTDSYPADAEKVSPKNPTDFKALANIREMKNIK